MCNEVWNMQMKLDKTEKVIKLTCWDWNRKGIDWNEKQKCKQGVAEIGNNKILREEK